MIPETSFLRQVPLILSSEQRIALDAIAISIDSIYLQYHKIRAWTLQCEPGTFVSTPRHEQIELFLSLWSIVDHAHALRLLFRPINSEASLQSFFDVTKEITNLRNAMDHLPANINNMSRRKGEIYPVFGAFSFGKPELDSEEINIEQVTIYTITAGTLTHQRHGWPIAMPTPGKVIDIPVGMFEFSAFDRTIDVSLLVKTLGGIVQFFDTTVRAHIENKIRMHAQKEGGDADKLINEYLGYYATVVTTKLVDE